MQLAQPSAPQLDETIEIQIGPYMSEKLPITQFRDRETVGAWVQRTEMDARSQDQGSMNWLNSFIEANNGAAGWLTMPDLREQIE